MGWRFMKKQKKELSVYAPISGELHPLSSLHDGVFSEELLGKGCVIEPASETLYAPFDGRVEMTVESGHAIGLMSEQGVELLIHVGLETVAMEGNGFHYDVKQGDSIKAGQQLMTFSKEAIQKAGCEDAVIVIVSNTKNFHEIELVPHAHARQEELLFRLY